MRCRAICLGPALLALLAGCASNPWEEHDESLYRYLRYATAESRRSHLELLDRVVAWNRKAGRKPPPGVLAEYGYFLALEGEGERALAALDEEARLYPESASFVGTLRRMVGGMEAPLNAPTGGGR